MKVVASIQARLGSTRLPGKVLYRLGDRRLLQWTVDRATAAEGVGETVVTTGDRPENKAITEFCDREKIEYTVGPEENLLSRHLDVAMETDCDLLVRITADCPFVPTSEIKRTVDEHSSNKSGYTRNDRISDGDHQMPIGTAVDVFDTELLEQLSDAGATHPNRKPLESPNEWDVKFTPNEYWTQFSEVHMAVDTPADYWRLIDAVEAVGDDPEAVVEWLAQ
jgi:spore coat polysaccharide biosynthesis protein SpsF